MMILKRRKHLTRQFALISSGPSHILFLLSPPKTENELSPFQWYRFYSTRSDIYFISIGLLKIGFGDSTLISVSFWGLSFVRRNKTIR